MFANGQNDTTQTLAFLLYRPSMLLFSSLVRASLRLHSLLFIGIYNREIEKQSFS